MLDLGDGIFEGGMAYVALSRCRMLSNVYIIEFDQSCLFCEPLAFLEYTKMSKQFKDKYPKCNIIPSCLDRAKWKRLFRKTFISQYSNIYQEFTHPKDIHDTISTNKNKRKVDDQHTNSHKKIALTNAEFSNDFKSYPLRLSNQAENSCFSNVVLQVIFHLGAQFYQCVNNLSARTRKINEFKIMFNIFYNQLSYPNPQYSSRELREFVVNNASCNEDKQYCNDQQHDAFLFFLALYRTFPSQVQDLFKFKLMSVYHCSCGNQKIITDRQQRQFTINLNTNSKDRMQNSIVVHVCAMNFFYVYIVPGPILRHLGEFGKIRLLLGENTRFFSEGGQYGYLEDGLWPIFNFFFFLCRI